MTEVSVTSGHNAGAHLRGTTNEHGVFFTTFYKFSQNTFLNKMQIKTTDLNHGRAIYILIIYIPDS